MMMRTLFSSILFALLGCASASAAVDQGLLALVPEGTVLLTGVDADATRSSDFGQFLLRRIDAEDQNFQKFMEDTGFDPRRDVQSFLFAGFGPHQTHGQSQFAILARGNFDGRRIAAAARTKGSLGAQSYAGVTIYQIKESGNDTVFAFPDTGIAVVGDLATVREIIDHRSNPAVLDPGLVQRLNKAGSDNDMWFASLMSASGSILGKHIDMASGQKLSSSDALRSILQSSGGIRFGELVKLSLDATTRSSQDAVSLTDVIRFASSMVQTQRQSGANAAILASALDKMELKSEGSNVHMAVSVSEKNLELLAESDSRRGQ